MALHPVYSPKYEMGLVDGDGRWVVPPVYALLKLAGSERVAFMRSFDDERWGYLDLAGRVVIAPRYESAGVFVEGIAVVSHAEGAELIRPDGSRALGPYEAARTFAGGVAPVCVDGAWGIIDREGRFVLDPCFEEIGDHDGSVFTVRQKKKWGLTGIDGVVRGKCEFQELGSPTEGRVSYLRSKKWGLLDDQGATVIPHRFAERPRIHEGHMAVREGKRWGLLDLDGNEVLPFEFDTLSAPHDGLCIFRRGKKRGAIDLEGKVAFEGDHRSLMVFDDGLAFAGDVLLDRRGQVAARIDFASAPTPGDRPGASPGPLDFDDRSFGVYLRAGLAMMGGTCLDGASPTVLEAVRSDHPDEVKAFLRAYAHVSFLQMGPLEMDPARTFTASEKRIAFATGDFESTLAIELESGSHQVVQTLQGSRTPWGTLDAFFEELWERGLGRDEPPPRDAPEAKRFESALTSAREAVADTAVAAPEGMGVALEDGSYALSPSITLVPAPKHTFVRPRREPPAEVSSMLQARGHRAWLYDPAVGVAVSQRRDGFRFVDAKGKAKTKRSPAKRLTSATLAPDGTYVAFSEGRTLGRLELPSGELSEPRRFAGSRFSAIVLLPDHTLVARDGERVHLARWSGDRYELTQTFEHPALVDGHTLIGGPGLPVVFTGGNTAMAVVLHEGAAHLVGPLPHTAYRCEVAKERNVWVLVGLRDGSSFIEGVVPHEGAVAS